LPMPRSSKDMGEIAPSLCSIYTQTSLAIVFSLLQVIL
jgi:hypothetical protein